MTRIVSHEEWLEAQRAHLLREKELTRLRDEIARERRALPWERIDKTYNFEGPEGRLSLADLFSGLGQLVIYHFMLGPAWKEGCPSCSFWADNYNGVDVHLARRDTALVAVSRAPVDRIEAYRQRMGWTFRWVSSLGGDFNFDFAVSFDPAKRTEGARNYNFATAAFGGEEAPGISVFRRGEDGAIYHTFSTYGRGLELVNGTYHMLDLTARGGMRPVCPGRWPGFDVTTNTDFEGGANGWHQDLWRIAEQLHPHGAAGLP
jgi:predicted dithiol-disulfide oxidoreductase (DUF899 family)